MRHRIVIQNRKTAVQGKFGIDSNGLDYVRAGEVWAAIDWKRGMSGIQEGALDVYNVIMVRCRWNKIINERSRIVFAGRTYQVQGDTFHPDYQNNTIQFNAQVIVNDKPSPQPEPSSSVI